jgi:hypothetical protein
LNTKIISNDINNRNKEGIFKVVEENGVAVDYLVNGCPLLLGCIWDVTDKDCDKLFMNLIK